MKIIQTNTEKCSNIYDDSGTKIAVIYKFNRDYRVEFLDTTYPFDEEELTEIIEAITR